MKHLKAKLMSAIAITLVAAIMMTTASYAWFTISTNPEIKGAKTEVVVNENLEIALAHTSATMPTAIPGASEPGDSLWSTATGNKDGSFTWGNLIELAAADEANKGVGYTAAEEYGKISTVLRPITLRQYVSIIKVGTDETYIANANKKGTVAYQMEAGTDIAKGTTIANLLDTLTDEDKHAYQKVAYPAGKTPEAVENKAKDDYGTPTTTPTLVTKTYEVIETFYADGTTHKAYVVDEKNYKYTVATGGFIYCYKNAFWYPKYGKDGRISNKYDEESDLIRFNSMGTGSTVSGMGMLIDSATKKGNKQRGSVAFTVLKGEESGFIAGNANYEAYKANVNNYIVVYYDANGKEVEQAARAKTVYYNAVYNSYAYFLDFWVRSNESGYLKAQTEAVKRSSGEASHDVGETGYNEGDTTNYIEGATAGTYFESKKCNLYMKKTELKPTTTPADIQYEEKYVVSDVAKARLALAANVKIAFEDITPEIKDVTTNAVVTTKAAATATIKEATVVAVTPVVTGLPDGVTAGEGFVTLNTTNLTITIDESKLTGAASLTDDQKALVKISFKTTFKIDDIAMMTANEAKLIRAYVYADGKTMTNAAASLLDNDNTETDDDGNDVEFTNDGKINIQFAMDEVKQSMDKVEVSAD